MKKDTSLHVRLKYNEAIQSKKDLLSLEMKILMILKAIKNYIFMRAEELNKKSEINKKLKDIKLNLKVLQTILPTLEKTYLQKEEEIEPKKKDLKRETSESFVDGNLEEQLREIQEKLLAIQ